MTLTAKITITVQDQEGREVADDDANFPIPEGFSRSSVGWAIGEAIRSAQRAFSVEMPEPAKEY